MLHTIHWLWRLSNLAVRTLSQLACRRWRRGWWHWAVCARSLIDGFVLCVIIVLSLNAALLILVIFVVFGICLGKVVFLILFVGVAIDGLL
ncbi:hypothetical protein KCU81_g211, partial [Aureobasidium melanogenum]